MVNGPSGSGPSPRVFIHNRDRPGANTFWQYRSSPRHRVSQVAHRTSERRSSPLEHQQVRGNVLLTRHRLSHGTPSWWYTRAPAFFFSRPRRRQRAPPPASSAEPSSASQDATRPLRCMGGSPVRPGPAQRNSQSDKTDFRTSDAVVQARLPAHCKLVIKPHCHGREPTLQRKRRKPRAVDFLDNRAGLWFPDTGGHDEDGGAGSGGESSQIWSCSSAGSLGKSVKRVVAISQRSKFRGCRCVSPGGGHWNMFDIGEQGCIASTQAIKSANLSFAGFYRVLLSVNRAERSLSLHTPTA